MKTDAGKRKLSAAQALQRMAAWCSRSERCSWDVRQKLSDFDLTDVEREQIMARLVNERFLDDSRFCRAFVNDRARYNRWGARKIAFELARRKIPATLIREALDALPKEESADRLADLLQQKRKTVKGASEAEIRMKLMRFAAGRGFSMEETERALKQCGIKY